MQEPHVYQMKSQRQSLAVFVLALGTLLPVGILVGIGSRQNKPIPWEAVALVVLVTVVFAVIGVYCVTFAFISRVTLCEDVIELRTLFSRKKLPFDQIRGRREYVDRNLDGAGARCFRLVPKDDRLSPLDFEKAYAFDDAFFRWFNELPDLDARDR
jgi:hypothetical protein